MGRLMWVQGVTMILVLMCCWSTVVRGGGLEVKAFGEVAEGHVVVATLRRGPLRLDLVNWGARITQLHLPDAQGNTADVVLGFDTLEGYQANSRFGAIVGRVANRIAGGTFVLDHVRYYLSQNSGNNTIHGGKIGFDKVLWDIDVMVDKSDDNEYVKFTYHSFDGEQGFPGDVNVTITYKITNDMDLIVDMKGVVGEKSTPVNLAQHTFWNLGGHNSGTIVNNTMEIASERVTLVDKELIPTGKFGQVKGTPYDFTKPKVIKSQITKLDVGYDINYELKGGKLIQVEGESLHFAAKVREPNSHRAMEVYTNQPGMQFYTGNSLNGVIGKDGATYGMHDALCLETQGFPNAVNQPNFPSVIIRPNHTYHHKMLYRFSIDK